MAAPINIGIASETKAYRMGIESGVISPTEKAEDALKDFAKMGDKAGDELERAMRTAQKESDKTRDEIEDVADAVVDASRKSRLLGSDVKAGMNDSGEAIREWGDEAKSNISETFSSFRGDADDLVGIVQDTFGGVISNLGPIGAVAGAAGALGVGLMTAAFQESAEKAEELRQETHDLALEIIEAGGNIDNVAMTDRLREWANAVRDNKEWWELWQESTVDNLDAVMNAQQYTKRSTQELFDAMSGNDPRGAIEVLAEVESQIGDVNHELDLLAANDVGWNDRKEALKEERAALEDVADAIREKQGFEEGAIERAEILLELTEAQAKKDEAAAAAIDARNDALGALQGELDEAVNSWGEYVDAETGATDPAAYIAAMQARMDATSNFNQNVQSLATEFNLSADEMQSILDQGIDFAPMLQSILDSGMGEEYATQIRAMLDGGQAILDGTPTTATVTTTAETAEADAAIDKTATDRETTVEATADTSTARGTLAKFVQQKRTSTVDVRVNLAQAEQALANWISRQRTMTVTVDTRDREGNPVL